MVNTTRRRMLGVLYAAGVGGVAGCRRTTVQDRGDTATAPPRTTVREIETPRHPTPHTTSSEDTPTVTPQTTVRETGGTGTATPRREFSGSVFRCQGDRISVERSLPDDEEPAAYFPANETVAYPALVSGDEIVEYDTMPFERWRVIRTAETAQGPVVDAVRDRLGTDIRTGLSRAPNADGPSLCVWVFVSDPATIEGTTPVTLQAVVERAPQSADVTLRVDEDLFSRARISRTVPVFATHHPPGNPG